MPQYGPGTGLGEIEAPATLTSTSPSSVPLTVAGASGQTSDLIDVTSNGHPVFTVASVSAVVNGVQITPGAVNNAPLVSAVGGDTNIGLTVTTKGTGPVQIQTGGLNSLTIQHTALSVNYITVTPAATTFGPSIAATGGDNDIDLIINSKGLGLVNVGPASASAAISGSVGPATLATTTGGATGPATATQNSWLAIKINGTISYIPVWR